MSEYQSLEEPNDIETVVELPHLDSPLDRKYKNRRELLAIETVEEKIRHHRFLQPCLFRQIISER